MSYDILKILNSLHEGWIKEYRFDSVRRFRFDYGNLKLKIAVEEEGGMGKRGHTNPKTFVKDMRKYNLAQIKGWIVLRYKHNHGESIPDKLRDEIIDDVKKAVEKREKERLEKERLEKEMLIKEAQLES